jgi:hypothetical protein
LLSKSLVLLATTFAIVACGGSGGDSTPTASNSAWDAPCGNPVQGATLADGWTDLCEVPAPVLVNGGWTDSAAITSSGLSLYFGYTTIDFGRFLDSNGSVASPSGPRRAGMTGDAFKMFRADLSRSGWTINFLPFNGSPTVHEASASPNAAEDTIVFSRFDNSGVATLHYSVLSGGSWATPVAFPTSPAINTPDPSCTNDNGFIVGSFSAGFTLYFESSRDDLAGTSCRADGKRRLYFATYNSVSGYSPPQEVPGLDGNLTNEDDTQISVSLDKTQVYFTRVTDTVYGVFTATWNGSAYANVRQIVTPNFFSPFTGKLVLIGEANVATTPQGSLLYMMCGIGQDEALAHDPAIRACFAKKPN